MTAIDSDGTDEQTSNPGIRRRENRQRKKRLRPLVVTIGFIVAVLTVVGGASALLVARGSTIKSELQAASDLVPALRENLTADERDDAKATVAKIRSHTAAAKDAADDPLWTLASTIPTFGANFSAVAEVARSADDVVVFGLGPLVEVFSSLDWDSLLPSSSDTDLQPLKAASPTVSSAADAVRLSAARLNDIDESALISQVSEPLTQARDQLSEVTGALDSAADAAEIIPSMLGSEQPRAYLLMIQNNAESRASGGIPGALAILDFDKGTLSLGAQSSASAVGVMTPVLPLDPEQRVIYSGRLGKFMQDVNLTPDFPSSASLAKAMWEKKTGQQVDGVLSIDPVALGYILDATGPVTITDPGLTALVAKGLPAELSGGNVVKTLLSDVYAKIDRPEVQDLYFAGVAQEIFATLSSGKGNAKSLVSGITRGANEGRVLVWSAHPEEQDVLSHYDVSRSIAGPSLSPAQFGIYFNDGTGAKMDYYVKRTVQLLKECPKDGYEQVTVRVTSTNTAPADSATTLPAYVTGGGSFGIPPGSVQTNIVSYGPVQANIELARSDGQKTDFAPYVHDSRPVGVLTVRLAPGESKTIEFTYGKIVQHSEPNLAVTPTVQDVKDVILPTQNAICGEDL